MGKIRRFIHFVARHRTVCLSGFGALFVIVWLVWRYTPTHRQMLRSTVVVKVEQWYELRWGKSDTLFFTSLKDDSLLAGLSTDSLQSRSVSYSVGSWLDHWALVPSCNGRLVVAVPYASQGFSAPTAASLLKTAKTRVKTEVDRLRLQSTEIRYFLHSHGVQDEGFGSVAEYSAKVDSRLKSALALQAKLERWNGKAPLKVRLRSAYTLYYYNWKDQRDSTQATMVAALDSYKLRLLQTVSHSMPVGMSAVKPLPWTSLFSGKLLAACYPGIDEPRFASVWAHPTLIPLPSRRDSVAVSPLISGEGAPLFTHHGRFVGILSNGRMVSKKKVMHLFSKEAEL